MAASPASPRRRAGRQSRHVAGERAAGAGTAQPVKVTSRWGPWAAQGPPVYRAGSRGCSRGTAGTGGSAGAGSLCPGRSKWLQPWVLCSVHSAATSQGGRVPCLLWPRRWVVTRGGRTAAPPSVLPLVVGGRTSLFFFFLRSPSPPARGRGRGFRRSGAGSCRVKAQTCFLAGPGLLWCSALCVMPACCVQFDKPWCWDGAGYRHGRDVNSCRAEYSCFPLGGAGFFCLFVLFFFTCPEVRGATYSVQTHLCPP